ncbi:DUF2577 family protein [Cohnella silvisoli]|uniref:DUF2577 family protein n=1 Tax=Cohnella silvisoli TaxID=2873699 RepID=A0ABV1KYY0_9BACL|nr:DUF2577 family protein [Cohnella silvisoli]MCD9024309.1 DUF2577 domain-containing protein [Cohnella silvisoli]
MPIEMVEGSGRAKLRSVIQALGGNSGVGIEFATVLAPLPAIRIKVDNCPIEFDADDLVISEHLTQHTRTASISGGAPVDIEYEAALNVNDRISVASVNDGQRYIVIDRIGGV